MIYAYNQLLNSMCLEWIECKKNQFTSPNTSRIETHWWRHEHLSLSLSFWNLTSCVYLYLTSSSIDKRKQKKLLPIRKETRFRWFYFRLILLGDGQLTKWLFFSFEIRVVAYCCRHREICFSSRISALKQKATHTHTQTSVYHFNAPLNTIFTLFIYFFRRKKTCAQFTHIANAHCKMAFVILTH